MPTCVSLVLTAIRRPYILYLSVLDFEYSTQNIHYMHKLTSYVMYASLTKDRIGISKKEEGYVVKVSLEVRYLG